MKIRTVGVVGAGTMGSGIAQLCAQNGFQVLLHDAQPQALARAKKAIEEGLAHGVARGKLVRAQAGEVLARVRFTQGLVDMKGADLIIEAVTEDLRLKQKIFKELGSLSGEAVLATNTSSLQVWAVAQPAAHPQRVVGMHFFNPPVAMKLVEMVRTSLTEDGVFKVAWDFAVSLHKTPVEVKDTPGFIVNRVMRQYYLRALRLANEGAGISKVDKAVRDLGRVPMGPFELMDLIGLDVNLAITRIIHEALGSPERLRPSPIQEWLVNAGNTGWKAGKGFYLYQPGGGMRGNPENPELLAILPEPAEFVPEEIWRRIMAGIVEEARLAHEDGVASREAIDTAIKLATNFPKGPFEWEKGKTA